MWPRMQTYQKSSPHQEFLYERIVSTVWKKYLLQWSVLVLLSSCAMLFSVATFVSTRSTSSVLTHNLYRSFGSSELGKRKETKTSSKNGFRTASMASFDGLSNNRPFIGVLAQTSYGDRTPYGKTFIRAAYVKYVESAGALPVPIRVNQSDEYYHDIFRKINGILFPGGGANIYDSPLERAALTLFNLAKQAKDKGDYFPLWGSCLGFELLTFLATGQRVISEATSEDHSLPLTFSEDFRSSRLFHTASEEVVHILGNENVTANFHRRGLLLKTYEENPALHEFFRVLSTNIDEEGQAFVSTFEARDYPFYGVQWHPEKNAFQWTPGKHLNHGASAVLVTQYMANFLVAEARKSRHRFDSPEDELKHVIYNYDPLFISRQGYKEQFYFFD